MASSKAKQQTAEQLKATLIAAAEGKRDRLTDIVARSVRIPSLSGSEQPVVEFYKQELAARDVERDIWNPSTAELKAHPAYVPVEYGYDDRQNIVARRRGTGGGRNLALFGHTDVVPVETPDKWKYPPFSGEIVDGKIYGRGSADMKGGCGVAVVALELLEELDVKLAGNVEAHLILDEEAGGNGTLAAVLRGHYGPETGCIMMEPTSPNYLLISNRGAQFFRITVPGQEGGTEYHRDLFSAIDGALVMYEAVKAFALMRESHVANPLHEDPRYVRYRRTRVPTAVCKVNAGAWPSTVAAEAVLEGTIECLPNEDIRQVVDAFERFLNEVAADHWFLKDHPIKFEKFGLWFESAGLDFDDPFVLALVAASREAVNKEPTVVGGGGSDLRLPVLYAKSPTVLWGPAGGMIHSVDEFVEIDQLVEMLKIVLVTAVDWCGLPE